jgi:hypothetical protein
MPLSLHRPEKIMSARLGIRVGLLIGAAVACRHAQGRELYVGAGYGEQIGLDGENQNNGIADIVYDFDHLDVNGFRFSIGAGFSWLWSDFDSQDVYLFCIVPRARYHLIKNGGFRPFVFATVAPSYLSETTLGDQHLGGHFTFNNSFGIGVRMGDEKAWSLSWCWRHISNAGLFKPNNGIDVPNCITLSREF